jgi:hypothetical protein
MKDEIIHKQDFDIFEHRYNELMQLKRIMKPTRQL